MNPLSKEAREALTSLDAREPTAADERRVRENLERTLGIVVPVATVTVATTATTAAASTGLASSSAATVSTTASLTSLGLGAKVVLFVAAVGVGSIAAMTVKSVVAPQSRAPAPIVQTVVTSKPAVAVVTKQVEAPPPVVAQPVVVVEESEPVAAVNPPAPAMDKHPAPRAPTVAVAKPVEDVINALPASITAESTPDVVPVPKPAEPTTQAEFELSVEVNFPNCDVATEMRSALAARRLLMENHPEHALFLLGAYQKRCASGRWSDEAWRVRLASLCRLGRNREATSLLEWFTAEYADRRPAIEAMLRGSCAPEVLDGPEKP